jgi:uncharacterized protein
LAINPQVEITLKASISPSESREKVVRAASSILGDCNYWVEDSQDSVVIRSRGLECLSRIHDQLRDRHVRDAARRLLLKNRTDSTTTLLLNRQAATMGIVALCSSEAESPLGPLVLELRTEGQDSLLEWLTAH